MDKTRKSIGPSRLENNCHCYKNTRFLLRTYHTKLLIKKLVDKELLRSALKISSAAKLHAG